MTMLPAFLANLQGAFLPETNADPGFASYKDNTLIFKKSTDGQKNIIIDGKTPSLDIRIAKNVSVDLHIIVWAGTSGSTGFRFKLAPYASATLLFTFLGNKNRTVIDSYSLREGAKLSICKGIIHSGNFTMQQKIDLEGAFAEAKQELFLAASGIDSVDLTEIINHRGQDTVSEMENNLVSVDRGNIFLQVAGKIDKGMHRSSCRQQNRGIILSEQAAIEVDPQLLIDDYDVDARHGAAIGEINEDELFYLLSRGLDEESAKKLIVSGYVKPYLDKMADSPLYKRIQRRIDGKIEGVGKNG